MKTVNYMIQPNSITLSFNFKLVTIAREDQRYEPIIQAIKNNDLSIIPDLVDSTSKFKSIEGLEIEEGRIKLKGKCIPEALSDRVLLFNEQRLPFEPLIKFAEKLQNNPSFRSRKMLYEFLEHNGHPITKDGNFIAYKKVRLDFTDCHTGKMDNSVGNTLTMERSEVDDDPNNLCSSGLHVASYNYANTFASGHLLEVEIDPINVVAVPTDYNGEKMRVCEYKVLGINKSILEEPLYSDYEEEDEDDSWWSDEENYR